MQQVSAAEGYRERCGMVFMEERISLVGRGNRCGGRNRLLCEATIETLKHGYNRAVEYPA